MQYVQQMLEGGEKMTISFILRHSVHTLVMEAVALQTGNADLTAGLYCIATVLIFHAPSWERRNKQH